jgi:hypothetical protein
VNQTQRRRRTNRLAVDRTRRRRCTIFTVLAVPLRSVEIDRFAINTDSPSTKRGAKYISFGWIIGPKGVSRVQCPEDLATLALILCRWISKAFTDPSGQPRLAQESWRARRGPARQSNPSRICWRCSDSFLAPAAATDSRSVCGPPVGSQAQELALGFAHTRFSRWCWGLHIPPSVSWLKRSDSIYPID